MLAVIPSPYLGSLATLKGLLNPGLLDQRLAVKVVCENVEGIWLRHRRDHAVPPLNKWAIGRSLPIFLSRTSHICRTNFRVREFQLLGPISAIRSFSRLLCAIYLYIVSGEGIVTNGK